MLKLTISPHAKRAELTPSRAHLRGHTYKRLIFYGRETGSSKWPVARHSPAASARRHETCHFRKNVRLPCPQRDLRTGSISRDIVFLFSELCRHRSGMFTEVARLVPPGRFFGRQGHRVLSVDGTRVSTPWPVVQCSPPRKGCAVLASVPCRPVLHPGHPDVCSAFDGAHVLLSTARMLQYLGPVVLRPYRTSESMGGPTFVIAAGGRAVR